MTHRAHAVALWALLSGGCDRGTTTDAKPTPSKSAKAAASATGQRAAPTDACASYVAFLDKCIAKLSDEQKPTLVKTRDKYKKLVDEGKPAELKQMASSCAMGLATTRKDALCKDVE